ncbi:hypothetical protein LCGC14_3023090, partial [marine sediment metagenome]
KDLYKQTGRPIRHQSTGVAGRRIPGLFQNKGKGGTAKDILQRLGGRVGKR